MEEDQRGFGSMDSIVTTTPLQEPLVTSLAGAHCWCL